jgi:hypothetical protein
VPVSLIERSDTGRLACRAASQSRERSTPNRANAGTLTGLAASRRWQTELLVENGSSTRCLYHQIVGRLRQHRLRERADGVQRDWDAHAPQRVGVSSGARECRVLSASQEAVDDRPSHVGVCLAAFLSAPRKYPWRALRREAAAPATVGHAVLVDADCQIEVDMPQEPIALSALIEN